MFFYCDDICQTIKLDDKIIYNDGYDGIFKGVYFNFPEFEAETGRIIQLLVQINILYYSLII